jgi:hypothetical protein
MQRRTRIAVGLAAALCSLALAAPASAAGNGEQASRKAVFAGVIYADGDLYGTNLNAPLPAPTEANRSSYDDLYLIAGQMPVAEAAPGPHYNGGRWAVVNLAWTDPSMAVELTSKAQIDQYLEIGALTATEAGVYFSCPLLPAG